MTRPAAECFEIQAQERGVKWSSVGSLLGALFQPHQGSPDSEDHLRVRVVIRERDTRKVLFDEPSGDAALADLARNDLATLDEAEFRDRWENAE
jgi:hypothetical protein